ncbi:TetR/AcrR family transcriptional regulator [Kitasatospora sp. NBC_01287]|uniref:TetR/AcrR family transcriptional regulator n=1 Tax=Kitasatospora sp. NBC_01287 TaxID=2903573 RepID=UPI002255E353|nr:TetR/AcrR family transcriptional regulator [Kitasatospora sp. NBC_01287]MCX4751664.1 TetR/AcrR family transcriptional regulator [Kitasatospora sp. NBC_01287]
MPDAPGGTINVRGSGTRTVRRDAVRNHRLVVDAARAVMSEHGSGASMELIASRAGVGVGTLYRHFPNKETLLDELVRLILDELIEAAETELRRTDGRGLERFLRVLGQSFADHRGYADKVFGRPQPEYTERLRALLTELLAQAQRHGAIRPDAVLADIQATAWALRGIVDAGDAVPADAWRRHLDLHLDGLRAPHPAR